MDKKKYVLFGAGITGMGAVNYFNKEQIEAIVDNSPVKVGILFEGVRVITLEEYLEKYRKHQIIISVYSKHYFDVKKQLEDNEVFDYFTAPPVLYGYKTPEQMAEALMNTEHKRVVFYGENPISNRMSEWIKENKDVECRFIKTLKEMVSTRIAEEGEYIELNELAGHDTVVVTTNEAEEHIRTILRKYEIKEMFDIYENPLHLHLELSVYKDMYKGQRCFVIGNGPSLKINDLDKLLECNEKSFGCNGIYRLYGKTRWRPTYYTITDIFGYIDRLRDVGDFVEENFFLADYYYTDLKQIEGINRYAACNKIYEDDEEFLFSEDITQGIALGRTVTYANIQLACYMGFDEIYLLGVDFTGGKGTGKQRKHFDNTDDGEVIYDMIAEEEQAYRAARRYAAAHNIKIYNATRGGELEVFERVSFESLFERE